MDQFDDINFLSGSTNCELVKYKENPIKDICLLTKNFDLSSMPANYMRKRSKIEEIIYRAIFSQNNHKSPFSSFKIAKNCLVDLDKLDIVTGINNLKKIIQSTYSSREQISIMVHRVADTWLLDEFDLDALFMRQQNYADWDWLRNFIKQESFQLTKPDLSRASLSMRDLYAKFLYHSVSQPSIEMSNEELEPNSSTQLSVVKRPIEQFKMESPTKFSNSSHRFDSKNEDFLNLVDWKLEDLSFVVGSDLSIFGTKRHPCISLRLSPCHEPINILTGIDMWLENMLNEVPEIAMCYHDQGIVMREYEILQTSDIPRLADFNEQEVKSIAKNLSHFLSTNATKEGHTYWLFKEADSTTVKLYDLTTIWEKDQYKKNNRVNMPANHDSNPFIIPVAILCYRMAENRVNQWHRAREKRGKTKLTSSQFNKELLDNKLADNEFYFIEIFRLLKNCINLLIKTGKHKELVTKAILMMCLLYLEVDQTTLDNFKPQQDFESTPGVTKFELDDFKREIVDFSSQPNFVPIENDLTLIGSRLFDYCAKRNTREILEQTIKLDSRGGLCLRPSHTGYHSLLFQSPGNTTSDNTTSVHNNNQSNQPSKTNNISDSLMAFYMRRCIEINILVATADELMEVIKSGFMVALIDDELSLLDEAKLLKEHEFYYAFFSAFLNLHIDLCGGDQSPQQNNSPVSLSDIDKTVLGFRYGERTDQFMEAIFLFKSVLMSEKKRKMTNINDKIHYGWYRAVVYLVSLGHKLSQLSLLRSKLNIIQRGMSILLNFLVASIVTLYQQKSILYKDSEDQENQLKEWCRQTVLPNIDLLTKWTRSEAFDNTVEDNLVALVWSNAARLYRLAAAVLHDCNYNYQALDSYTSAIDSLSKSFKKKPSQMSITLKCDRLDLCMIIVENAYVCLDSENQNSEERILEMNRALEYADKIHRTESSLQSISVINMKLTSLRLRMNFVRYYLNLKADRSLDNDHILNEFKNDLNLILRREDSLSRCKESILIEFYMFKIQLDRCEILTIGSIKKFLQENLPILRNNLDTEQYTSYFETEGKSLIEDIVRNLISILQILICKSKGESNRKKKRQIDLDKIIKLDLFLQDFQKEFIDNLSSIQSLLTLLSETERNIKSPI